MSTGALTVLDTQINKQERFLIADDKLKRRLANIKQSRLKDPKYQTADDARLYINDIRMTHNIFIQSQFKPHVATAHEYFKTQQSGNQMIMQGTNNRLLFDMSLNNGVLIADQVIHFTTPVIQAPAGHRIRYCDFPALRAIKCVKIIADSLVIDEFNTNDYIYELMCIVNGHNIESYSRMLGQEIPRDMVVDVPTYGYKEKHTILNDAQTFKTSHRSMVWWYPLIFDFNKHLERALLMDSVLTQDLKIEITLATLEEIVQVIDANNNLVPLADTTFPKSITFITSNLYTRNIYFPRHISDIFRDRRYFTLLRVRRREEIKLLTGENEIQLKNLKYPVEYLMFGIQPDINRRLSNVFNFEDWWFYCIANRDFVSMPVTVPSECGCQSIALATGHVKNFAPTATKYGFKIGSNDLYKLINSSFYADYLRTVYPGIIPRGPCGVHVISFAHTPCMRNPNGHVNLSTQRDFSILYESSYITTETPATLYVTAICLNMLVLNGKSIELKYMT